MTSLDTKITAHDSSHPSAAGLQSHATTGHSTEWQKYAAMLRAARERLANLRVDDPAIPASIAGLTRIEAMLRRPLRVVVLGEYNSGKTSVAGLIIGSGLLPVSVISNTGVPVLIGYGEQPALYGVNENGISIRIDGAGEDTLTDLDYRAVDIRLPLPWLQHHQVLDTPATLTPALFAADADVVVWCTVATRAWTESERNLWASMPRRSLTTALLIATHKDSFYSDEDCEQVLRRLKAVSAGIFRDTLLVSAAAPAGDPDGTASQESETAILRAAIDGSAAMIWNRRLVKARRIVQRLARFALHEFGRNAISPQSSAVFEHWYTVTDRALQDHAIGRLTQEHTARAIIHAFAHAAEALRPGIIHAMAKPAARARPIPPVSGEKLSMPHRPAILRADFTAVLRLLASHSRFEPPDTREQREAARATLMALADLDGIFAGLGQWLSSPPPSSDARVG